MPSIIHALVAGLACIASASAFTMPATGLATAASSARRGVTSSPQPAVPSTRRAGVVVRAAKDDEFRWNINANRSPYGFADNAEVWNGRVGMMSFVYLFIQEAIFGPVMGQDKPFGSLVMSGAFVLGLLGTSALIAFNQENDEESRVKLNNVEEYM